ncbi:MAG: VanW family protein, partial [Acidimicrobiia bacterium]
TALRLGIALAQVVIGVANGSRVFAKNWGTSTGVQVAHADLIPVCFWQANSIPPMPRSETRRRLMTALVVLAVLLVVFAGGVAAFYLTDTDGEPRTIRGLEVSGRDAGDLTVDEFADVVADISGEVAEIEVRIDLPDGPRFLSGSEAGISVDEADLEVRAFEAGRAGGSLDRFTAWLASFTSPRVISHRLVFDRDRAAAAVSALDGLVVSLPVEPELALAPDEGLVVTPGIEGIRVDEEAVVSRLANQVEAGGPYDVDAPTLTVEPDVDDDDLRLLAERLNVLTADGATLVVGEEERTIPAIALRVRLNTQGAGGGPAPSFDLDSLQRLIEHTFGDVEVGGDEPRFDIVDDAPVLLEPGTPPDECCSDDAAATVADAIFSDRPGPIGLDTRPNDDPRRIAWAEGTAIVEEVSEFTTSHNCCENRVSNIQRFADIVRGTYLVPGESLSLNGLVGERTTEDGFVPAGTILQGHLVSTVGGGVSQFATTMFNAAFFAGFDFDTYQSHSIYFSRYPYGREATISWPAPDLAFTNTTEYPALIWTSYTGTSITVSVYSTKSVEVEQVRQEVGAARQCTRVDTFRLRTYADGREVEDSVFATYRPAEGFDCNGNPTELPDM